jgi:FkbM family methyltransferase
MMREMERGPAYVRVKQCRHGRMMYNVNDQYIGRSLDLYGEYSEGEVDLFRQVLRPGDLALDVGANIGVHTVPMARLVGERGAVFAFEAQRTAYQTLCGNVAVNGLLHVWCHNVAVGDSPGSIIVPVLNPERPNNFGGLALGKYAAGDRIPISRLDDTPMPACRFIKVDVEGMELQVLRGAAKLIERFRPVLYVENDKAEKSAELIRHIDSLGYDLYWHRPPLFNPQNFLGHGENVFADVLSHNMLCLHRSHVGKMEGFPPVEVPK